MEARPIVFVVDDDSDALSSAEALFTAFDYTVRSFASAEAFLAAFENTDVGCLLSDVRMPGMTGLELNAALKLRKNSLPVILISGYADSEVAEAAIKNGVIAVLDKPINSNELLDIVDKAIQLPTGSPCRERERTRKGVRTH